MPKICIDAGHYAKYNCNKNVSPIYWESLMAWELHNYLADELLKYQGMEIVKTRENEATDLGLTARGQMARGCDLFISIHSNACNTESVDRAVVIYPVSGKEKDLAKDLADTITEVMTLNDKPQLYQMWNSAHNADYYGVIRGAASVGVPGLILEHSFHTNNKSARWLSVSDNLKKLAKAEAEVIARRYGCKLKGQLTPHHPFVDVPAEEWYAIYIQWAWEEELMNGVDATHFEPDRPLTRAEAAALLCRIFGRLG